MGWWGGGAVRERGEMLISFTSIFVSRFDYHMIEFIFSSLVSY